MRRFTSPSSGGYGCGGGQPSPPASQCGGGGEPAQSDAGGTGADRRCYRVVHSAPNTRKRKTWEADGVLVVQAGTATLYADSGAKVGRSNLRSGAGGVPLCGGDELTVAGRMAMVEAEIDCAEFATGACFAQSSGVTSALQPKALAAAALPPLPASSGRPHASQFAGTAAVSRRARAGFVCPVREGLGKFTEARTGLTRTRRVGEPLYDANAAGAYLLPAVPPAICELHAQCFNRHNGPDTRVVLDPRLARALRPYQLDGVAFMYECAVGLADCSMLGCVLADEMGLGKSVQTIALIWTLLKQGPYGRPLLSRALLVCPTTLVQNWKNEFNKWLGDERLRVYDLTKTSDVRSWMNSSRLHPVLILSYETLIRCADKISGCKFDVVVCDEGHRLKNAAIRAVEALNKIDCARRVILTGTPLQNDLQELYAVCDFVNPGILGTANAFRRTYEEPISRGQRAEADADQRELSDDRLRALLDITSTFMLRRTSDVNAKYLPRKDEYTLFCRPSGDQLRAYDAVLHLRCVQSVFNAYLGGAASYGTGEHLACVDALRKLANHPAILYNSLRAKGRAPAATANDSDDYHIPVGFHDELRARLGEPAMDKEPTMEQSGKMSVLCDLLELLRERAPAEKIIIVSYFTTTLHLIATVCSSLRLATLSLTGSVPAGQRQEIVDTFNGPYDTTPVLLLSSKAGGVGLNLVGARRIVLYDVDWNPANDVQALARVWRPGQRRRCFVYRLLTAGTIEEKILQRQVKKQGIADAVVQASNGGAAGGGGAGTAAGKGVKFTVEELRDVFTLHPDAVCHTHELLNCDCLSASDGERRQQRADSANSHQLSHLQHWLHGDRAAVADGRPPADSGGDVDDDDDGNDGWRRLFAAESADDRSLVSELCRVTGTSVAFVMHTAVNTGAGSDNVAGGRPPADAPPDDGGNEAAAAAENAEKENDGRPVDTTDESEAAVEKSTGGESAPSDVQVGESSA